MVASRKANEAEIEAIAERRKCPVKNTSSDISYTIDHIFHHMVKAVDNWYAVRWYAFIAADEIIE